MKNNIKLIALLLLNVLMMSSCSKKDENQPEQGSNNTQHLEGKLIYSFTGTVYQLDLKTNVQSVYFTYNTYGFNTWDLSWDAHYRLISERQAGVFDVAKITLVRNSDGSIVDEFDYASPVGTDTQVGALLSPDNAKVVYQPTLNNGIVITDLDGKVLHHLQAVNVGADSLAFGISDEVLWLPDNTLLFTLADRYIFKSSPPYSSLSLVKDMPYTEWGNLRVNKEGTRISMQLNHHIHLMDIDGKNLRQVTESKGAEIHADFSVDGKHLVVAKKYGDYLYYWNLAIIPNDGQLHNMDDGKETIIIKPEGEITLPAVDGATFWIK